MSMDRSLRSANSLVRHRNVLTRAERLDKLAEDGKWSQSNTVFGLPKVEHRKQQLIKEAPKEAPEAAAVPGAVPPVAGAPAAPAAPGAKTAAASAKGAAPAKGAPPTPPPAAKARAAKGKK